MRERLDILDERDAIKRPLIGSLVLHAAVAAAAIFSGWMAMRPRATWGDPNASGGATVGITPVKQLPVSASQALKNPVAADTPSEVPPPPKPEPKARVKEDPDAIPIKSPQAKKKQSAPLPKYDARKVPPRPMQDNQLTSRTGQAASSPMYGATPGSGGVGVGTGTPFGARCGAYANLIRDRVGQKWRTDEVDPRINTAPPVIVLFEVARDGAVRNVRVAQSSNLVALDNSARRAILEAGPFPPIPPQCQDAPPTVEFWFQLKR